MYLLPFVFQTFLYNIQYITVCHHQGMVWVYSWVSFLIRGTRSIIFQNSMGRHVPRPSSWWHSWMKNWFPSVKISKKRHIVYIVFEQPNVIMWLYSIWEEYEKYNMHIWFVLEWVKSICHESMTCYKAIYTWVCSMKCSVGSPSKQLGI